MRRVSVDPYRILLAIEYVGKNGPVPKKDFIRYLSEFSDSKENSKNTPQNPTAAANDVLYNLRELRFIQGDDTEIVLTSQTEDSQIHLYSGKDVFSAYSHKDHTSAMKMLQTNALFYSPEIRDVAAFIYRKKGASRAETGVEYVKKSIHNHNFNQFTIDTTLTELERLEILRKEQDGTYEILNLHDLIFAQLLTEEIITIAPSDLVVNEHQIKDLFDLKYGLKFSEFDVYFNRLRKSCIPNLVVQGSYGKFSINIDVAKEVKLI